MDPNSLKKAKQEKIMLKDGETMIKDEKIKAP